MGRHGANRTSRCAVHTNRSVRETGRLWHHASADGLAQCPLGCWIDPCDVLTHVCPRVADGPIAVPQLGKIFNSFEDVKARAAETVATRRIFCIGEAGPLLQVVVAGRERMPVSVRVVLPCPTRADWVRVTWASPTDDGAPTHQHVLVTPHTNRGDVLELLPKRSHNAAAQPPLVDVVSVHPVETCRFRGPSPATWTPLFAHNWLVWSAVQQSPCACARYPYVNGTLPKHRRLAAPPDGSRVYAMDLSGPHPAQPPACADLAHGQVQCAHCGTVHATEARFIAHCAPDASPRRSPASPS